MHPRREAVVLATMCVVAVLLSLAGVVWVFWSGMGWTLDSLFLILVGLSMGGVFSLVLVLQLRSAGWLPRWWRRDPGAQPSGEPR